MENPKYILKLPKPHKDLSPNSRCHWSVKAKITKTYKFLARCASNELFKDLINSNLFEPYKSATIKRVFYFNQNRRRDKDNAEASCKCITDGLVQKIKDGAVVEKGILFDDNLITWLPTEFIINPELDRSYLEYHFYKLEY